MNHALARAVRMHPDRGFRPLKNNGLLAKAIRGCRSGRLGVDVNRQNDRRERTTERDVTHTNKGKCNSLDARGISSVNGKHRNAASALVRWTGLIVKRRQAAATRPSWPHRNPAAAHRAELRLVVTCANFKQKYGLNYLVMTAEAAAAWTEALRRRMAAEMRVMRRPTGRGSMKV
jgi:hypothetical protein